MTDTGNSYDISTIGPFVSQAVATLGLDPQDVPILKGIIAKGGHRDRYPHTDAILQKAEDLYVAALGKGGALSKRRRSR